MLTGNVECLQSKIPIRFRGVAGQLESQNIEPFRFAAFDRFLPQLRNSLGDKRFSPIAVEPKVEFGGRFFHVVRKRNDFLVSSATNRRRLLTYIGKEEFDRSEQIRTESTFTSFEAVKFLPLKHTEKKIVR